MRWPRMAVNNPGGCRAQGGWRFGCAAKPRESRNEERHRRASTVLDSSGKIVPSCWRQLAREKRRLPDRCVTLGAGIRVGDTEGDR